MLLEYTSSGFSVVFIFKGQHFIGKHSTNAEIFEVFLFWACYAIQCFVPVIQGSADRQHIFPPIISFGARDVVFPQIHFLHLNLVKTTLYLTLYNAAHTPAPKNQQMMGKLLVTFLRRYPSTQLNPFICLNSRLSLYTPHFDCENFNVFPIITAK